MKAEGGRVKSLLDRSGDLQRGHWERQIHRDTAIGKKRNVVSVGVRGQNKRDLEVRQ